MRAVIQDLGQPAGLVIDFSPDAQVFPDIVIGEFGIEVKFTTNDTWRSIANSVFESTRSPAVRHIYLVFGKMGGTPEVRWGRYEDCVMHVRTSHVPRFEVELSPTESLFKKFGVTYQEFAAATLEEKMKHIRQYARRRLKPGERLWWLGDSADEPHTLPLEVRLYMHLPQMKKRQLRAEGALLCPQIVGGSRKRNKYNDVTNYILTYHGVLCPQARDLFSAGSVALRANSRRGGNYLMRSLQDIEPEMRMAAANLEDALFVEYWGKSVAPAKRISEWLRRADAIASGWTPSDHLFRRNGR